MRSASSFSPVDPPVKSHGNVDGAFSLEPRRAQRLHQACPDPDDWPLSWHVEPADIFVGQQIVQALMPFLLHPLDQRLVKATLRRRRQPRFNVKDTAGQA